MIEEIGPMLAVVFVMFASLAFFRRKLDRSEMGIVQLSAAVHVASVFAQVWITRDVYGIGDMLEYWRSGVVIADAMHYDFAGIAPEVGKLIFRGEPRFPFETFPGAATTNSMLGLVSLVFFVIGESLYAGAMVISFAAFLGKLGIYFALRTGFARHLHPRLLIACLLVPSVVFWSSGILKESVAMAGVGLMFLGLPRIEQGKWFSAVVMLGLGGLFVGLVKPYILFPFALATGVWFYWMTSTRRGATVVVKPVYLAMGIALAGGGVIALGAIFPNYAVDRLGERTAEIQAAGERVEGGSSYSLGDTSSRSLAGQLAYAPLALGTALFRPVLFEVRNPQMLINALETTILMLLFVRAVFQRSWRWIKDEVVKSPMLMFCVVYAFSFAVAVGLASTNLGTLSRYRIPMVPFFAALLLVLSAPAVREQRILRPSDRRLA